MSDSDRWLPEVMVQRTRIGLVGGVALVLAILGVVAVAAGNNSGSGLPRVRMSIPGLDNEADFFAEDSAADRDHGARSEVIEVESIDQIRMAFDADQGHPRLILLVDPI